MGNYAYGIVLAGHMENFVLWCSVRAVKLLNMKSKVPYGDFLCAGAPLS